MERDRARVLGCLLAFLALTIAGLFVLDWFVATIGGIGKVAIDLREVHVCPVSGPCLSMSYSGMRGGGMFPTFATATFYGMIAFSLLVVFQAGTRIVQGFASQGLTRTGYSLGALMLVLVVCTAYLFGPEPGKSAEMSAQISRTWAPLIMLAACVLGMATLSFATREGSVDAMPRVEDPVPAARVVAHERTDRPVSGPIPTMPEKVRGKLQFAVLAAEITRAGIDARREDATSLLVMWRDVVGVVARRLPPELDGTTFVDVVSTAGSTLRVLPWTRLTGDLVEGEGDARARKLVELVVARCGEIKLDAATRAFLESSGDAAQLPDLAKLAAHDQRLA